MGHDVLAGVLGVTKVNSIYHSYTRRLPAIGITSMIFAKFPGVVHGFSKISIHFNLVTPVLTDGFPQKKSAMVQ